MIRAVVQLDGRPLADRTVRFRRINRGEWLVSRPVVSDGRGWVESPGLVPGTYRLAIDRASGVPWLSQRVDLRPGQAVDLAVELTEQSLVVAVRDHGGEVVVGADVRIQHLYGFSARTDAQGRAVFQDVLTDDSWRLTVRTANRVWERPEAVAIAPGVKRTELEVVLPRRGR